MFQDRTLKGITKHSPTGCLGKMRFDKSTNHKVAYVLTATGNSLVIGTPNLNLTRKKISLYASFFFLKLRWGVPMSLVLGSDKVNIALN